MNPMEAALCFPEFMEQHPIFSDKVTYDDIPSSLTDCQKNRGQQNRRERGRAQRRKDTFKHHARTAKLMISLGFCLGDEIQVHDLVNGHRIIHFTDDALCKKEYLHKEILRENRFIRETMLEALCEEDLTIETEDDNENDLIDFNVISALLDMPVNRFISIVATMNRHLAEEIMAILVSLAK